MSLLKSQMTELRDKIRTKEVKSEEVVSSYLGQIDKLNKDINAFITVSEQALEKAREIDRKLSAGEELGRLAGVPIAIKDLLCTKGTKTTAGSKILHNFIPPYSATVVERLEKAGAIVLGKCNMDEFAMGSSNEISHAGPTKNPWNTEYVPGGSSGGSAAAVAALMAPAAIGTDTGGSIRQPSSFCGVVGVKPTYGRVSRYGIIAFASSLDQAGPMARSVRDCAEMLEVISGVDEMDSTTSPRQVPQWSQSLTSDLKGMKVGMPKEYFSEELGEDTRKAVENAIEVVKQAGAEVVEVSIPLTEVAVPIYYLIATSEASSNLARYDGVRYGYRADFSEIPAKDLTDFYCRTRGEGFGPEVKRRIMLGTYALSSGYYDAYYKKACQVRRLLREQYLEAFKQCDVMLTPVSATPAFKIGERIEDPLQMYLNDIFTTSANLAGIPGMSVPAGFSSDGLPIGVQITAAHFEEQKMMNAAYAIESALKMNEKVPNVVQ